MKKTGKLVANDILSRNIHRMTFDMGECEFKQPGQYADLEAGGIGGPYQVCDFDSNRFTIVFPIIDRVSEVLAGLKPGADAVKSAPYVCASGSIAMLKELAGKVDEGQFSLSGTVLAESTNYDERFVETTEGRLNCSDDGPVFDKNIILWDKII